MPARRLLTMRQIRRALRLHHDGAATRDIGRVLGVARSTVQVAAKVKGSAIDGRTTRHAGYKLSQVIRKRIEEVFGWAKSAAGLRKPRHRGLGRVGWQFTFTLAAYNLIRLPRLLAQAS